MRSTRRVIVDRFGGPEVLELVDGTVAAPEPGQILVRVEAAGVLYGDVMRRTDRYVTPTALPYAPGTEVAGIVVEVGAGVAAPNIGDRVICRVGGGGYAQYALAEAAGAIALPDDIGFGEAAALLAQGLTAYLLTHEVASLKGKSVFIESAAGGVGSQMVQMARALGAAFVVGSASSAQKRAFARRNGADLVVDTADDGWPGQVLAATGGRGIDVGYESSGAAFAGLLACLGPFGMLVKFGRGVDERLSLEPSHLLAKNQSLRGFYLPGYFGADHAALLADAMRVLIASVLGGELKLTVGHRFPLDQAAEAHRAIEERRTVGKIVLEPWSAEGRQPAAEIPSTNFHRENETP